MTQSQERAINKIKRASIWMDGLEIKRFEIEDFIGFVSLYIEVGNIGDDDTLASIICRDRVHVFIGKRGGITYPVHKKLKDGSHKHFKKKYKSFLSTALDQR